MVVASDPRAFFFTLGLLVIGAVYYFGYSRNRLVAKSVDEEFALLARAEADLA